MSANGTIISIISTHALLSNSKYTFYYHGAFMIHFATVQSASDREQSESGLASDLWSEDPFTLLANARSRITSEPINGVEVVFSLAVTIFDHNFKRKVIRYWILSLQVASIPRATLCCFWLNIEPKSKCKLPTILVQNRKQVNISRYSVEDNLIGWWVGRPRQIGSILSLGGERSDV